MRDRRIFFLTFRETYDDMTVERRCWMEDMNTNDLKMKMRWRCNEKAWITYLVF